MGVGLMAQSDTDAEFPHCLLMQIIKITITVELFLVNSSAPLLLPIFILYYYNYKCHFSANV